MGSLGGFFFVDADFRTNCEIRALSPPVVSLSPLPLTSHLRPSSFAPRPSPTTPRALDSCPRTRRRCPVPLSRVSPGPLLSCRSTPVYTTQEFLFVRESYNERIPGSRWTGMTCVGLRVGPSVSRRTRPTPRNLSFRCSRLLSFTTPGG